MHRFAQDDQKKLLILALTGLLLSVGFAIILNTNLATRARSDLYLRWYATGKLFSEGRSLYDSRNAAEVTTFVHGSPLRTNFYYPAHLLVFTGPLALLPYPTAHLIWTIAVQLFFLFGVWLTARLASWPVSINGLTAFLVAAVLFIPNVQHTIWGQFNTIGLLSLVLCYYALRKGRYGVAGVFAVGLTFKPHVAVLTLAFLLIWALLGRERWGFFLGFGLSALILWGIAEILLPGWLPAFFSTLGVYRTARSVVDLIWNPYQVTTTLICLGVLGVFIVRGREPVDAPAFAGCLALSVAAWSLVVPIIGMMHIVLLPIAVLLVLSGLRSTYPTLYVYGLAGAIVIYLLGVLGFVVGLAVPGLYGKHITWSMLAYETAAPICIVLLSIPLCFHPSRPFGKGRKTTCAA